MRQIPRHTLLIAMLAACVLLILPAAASATRPGMTVRIPVSQDVDNVYALAAIHQRSCSLQVSGTVLGRRFRGYRDGSVTIHVTNTARLRLSSSGKRAVKRALRRGRTVRARITVVARNRSGERNRVSRSVRLRP